ncbi:MAG: alanine--tRNA ligase [Actinomycetota bacterium]|nr:alanine--tRNA ligase [Actinomycetota bacterium]
MDSNTIRQKFVAFFEERGHTRVPSSSLVPNEPSLLLTNAGMNQFKPYFLGDQQAPWVRAVSVQKCFRTTDIDEVGKTARHLTFFEMLGNFSFGDYYKQKACPWAWELVTESFGIDPELLWVTIYETDDEAHGVWADEVGVRPERILPWDKENNFWSMGVAGPCGPCSEIYVDLGERFGEPSDEGPIGNGDRYLEIWNLVFMQNDCNAAIEPVAELPRKNIDTGAGVERLAQFLQGAASIYETDTIGTLVETAARLTGRSYGSDARTDRGLRILADHGRSLTFLIGDGVMPSNTERGYVLRRVMRRAIREARLLGRTEPVLPHLITTTIDLMGGAYPELAERRDFVLEVADREEQRFDETLRQGMSVLEGEIGKARDLGAGVPGDAAFRLHDSFGFPIDLTVEIAGESGLDVDIEAFEVLMAEQRNRARAARKTGEDAASVDAALALLEEHGATEFVGDEHLRGEARVIGILDGHETVPVASEGDAVDLVLDRTTFYAEGGGQVGDHGALRSSGGHADVLDTRRIVPGLTGHRVKVRAGEIRTGDEVELEVDAGFRHGCERAHTATHILHWVLRDHLGEHATQAGSLVEPGRLRFDFNHFDALAGEQLTDVAGELQTRVGADDGVRAYETSFDYARSIGAMAIFGEKYGDFVRVVEVGDYSKELCGGTHVAHTSQIGVVVVTGESSVGANLRRVEALVGREGLSFLESKLAVLARAATVLKTNPDEVAERVERLVASHKELERKLAETEQRSIEADAAALAEEAQDVGGTRVVVARRDVGVDNLRKLAQLLKGRLGSAVVVLGAAADGKANLVAALTKDLVSRGLSARELLGPGARLLGGGAGGKPELSISGGPAADRVDEALQLVAEQARQALRG